MRMGYRSGSPRRLSLRRPVDDPDPKPCRAWCLPHGRPVACARAAAIPWRRITIETGPTYTCAIASRAGSRWSSRGGWQVRSPHRISRWDRLLAEARGLALAGETERGLAVAGVALAAAVPLYRRTIEVRQRVTGMLDCPGIREPKERLATLYTAMGRTHDAAELRL